MTNDNGYDETTVQTMCQLSFLDNYYNCIIMVMNKYVILIIQFLLLWSKLFFIVLTLFLLLTFDLCTTEISLLLPIVTISP